MNERSVRRPDDLSGGFTLIEVLMALAVLAVGVVGIYSLQLSAVRGVSDAQEITAATGVARRFLETLRQDAVRWNDPSMGRPGSDLTADTTYLKTIVTAPATWTTPAVGTLNPWARDAAPTTGPMGQFCVQYRLAWVNPALANQVMVADVRVFWHRPGANRTLFPNCGAGVEAAMSADTTNLRWVYATSTVRRTVL